jgi:hypothetical protein
MRDVMACLLSSVLPITTAAMVSSLDANSGKRMAGGVEADYRADRDINAAGNDQECHAGRDSRIPIRSRKS